MGIFFNFFFKFLQFFLTVPKNFFQNLLKIGTRLSYNFSTIFWKNSKGNSHKSVQIFCIFLFKTFENLAKCFPISFKILLKKRARHSYLEYTILSHHRIKTTGHGRRKYNIKITFIFYYCR